VLHTLAASFPDLSRPGTILQVTELGMRPYCFRCHGNWSQSAQRISRAAVNSPATKIL